MNDSDTQQSAALDQRLLLDEMILQLPIAKGKNKVTNPI